MTRVLNFVNPNEAAQSSPHAEIPFPAEATVPFLRRMTLTRAARVIRQFLDFLALVCVVTAAVLFLIFVCVVLLISAISDAGARFRELWRDEWHGWITRAKTRTCRSCWAIHDGWHRCPNRIVAFCQTCGRKRFLNRFGECNSGHDEITDVQFRTTKGGPAMKKTLIL